MNTTAISAVRNVIIIGIMMYTASGIFCSEYVRNAAGVLVWLLGWVFVVCIRVTSFEIVSPVSVKTRLVFVCCVLLPINLKMKFRMFL